MTQDHASGPGFFRDSPPEQLQEGRCDVKVLKRINNNVVLVAESGIRMIVTGKGIGFKAYPGDEVNRDFIEQRYVLQDGDNVSYYIELLRDTPPKLLSLAKAIIDAAQIDLGHILPQKLVFTLADHIVFALKRLSQGMRIDHPMAWEIRQFYPSEYQAGEHSLELLRAATNIDVPEAEAAFFAMHYVNALGGLSGEFDATDMMATMQGAIAVIERHFGRPVDGTTRAFSRFVVHLRYCLMGQTGPEAERGHADSTNDELYRLVKTAYPESFACAVEVAQYLQREHGTPATSSSVLYLTLHINRLMASQEASHDQ